MLEEAYEAIAAIDSGDPKALASELGDVLLQVVLHSQIASESGEFSMDDVIAGLSAKLQRRHPHVFGDASNDLPSIHRRWEEIKAGEGGKRPTPPPFVRARKAITAMDKRIPGVAVDHTVAAESQEEKVGLRILQAIGEAWRGGVDPELALQKALDRLEQEIAE